MTQRVRPRSPVPDPKWINSSDLYVSFFGRGMLEISNGGLVGVAGTLYVDRRVPHGDSFINLSNGGMLALKGYVDDSLPQFLSIVEGADTIRYWDADLGDWDLLTNATCGVGYTLEYLTAGDFAGYTVLTVGVVPEPASLALQRIAHAGLLRHRVGWQRQRRRR